MADTPLLIRRPGQHQGRVIPTRWTAPEGEYVGAIGSAAPGYTGRFAPDDAAIATLNGTYVNDTIAVCKARIYGTLNDLPAGWSWIATNYNIDGAVWSHEITPREVLDMADLAVPLDDIAGGFSPIGFSLTVAGPPGEEAELEIPAMFFDAIVLVEDPLGVYNRTPSPNQVGVPRSSSINFHLMTTSGVQPTIGNTDVYVGGVPALLAGVSQPGWIVTEFPSADTMTLKLRVEPVVPFDSLAVVDVRVVSQVPASLLDTTWSFTVIDETAPIVHSASSPTHDRVRVRFDEPVKMTDAAATDDALNPSNYAIAPTMAPAVTVVPVGVEIVSPFEVDVLVDIPLTQGATYVVTVTNVEDLLGNVVAPPQNTATFVGYECAVPQGRRFELWRMVSDMDRRRDETRDLYKFLSVLQEPVDLLLCDVDRWVEIIDVDIAEERYIDQMLITLGNPFDFDLDLVDKRRLVRTLIRVYQQKGTGVGIINVIRFFLGLEVTIDAYNQDGWELGVSELGVDTFLLSSESFAKYSFVVVSPVILTDEQRDRIDQLVDYMKPAHTHHITTIEPTIPEIVDHVELGLSVLGDDEWMLH